MPEPDPHRATELIRSLCGGDPAVAEELLPLIYDELRAMANSLFVGQPRGHTLQPTAVVHEAWLKLAGREQAWESRGHFFAVAARAMRQVLTDHARARRTDRRGGGWRKVTFEDDLAAGKPDYDLVDVDDALQRLGQANKRHARVAELRLFAGMNTEEMAGVLGVTTRTVQMDWRAVRAYLCHVLEDPRT